MCALVLILGVVAFLCYRRYRKRPSKNPHTVSLDPPVTPSAPTPSPDNSNTPQLEATQNQEEADAFLPSKNHGVIYELINDPELLNKFTSKLGETHFSS